MGSINEPTLTSATHPTIGPRPIHSAGQNADRDPPSDVLGSPGDNYDVYKYSPPMSVLRRRPLDFAPRSTARHNFGLLPDLAAMADMSLAYRHRAFRQSEIEGAAHSRVVWLFVAAAALPIPAILLGRLVPIVPALAAAAVVSVIWLLYQLIVMRQVRLRRLLIAAFAPAAVVLAFKAFAIMFTWRILGAGIGAAIAYFVALKYWRLPFEFYLDWLHTHPRLKPESRKARAPLVTKPNFKLLAIILVAIVFGPLFSTGFTMLALCALPFVVLAHPWSKLATLIHTATHILSPYVTYGGADAHAPGVWRPSQPYAKRSRVLTGLCVPFMVALSLGLTLFIPIGDYYLKYDMPLPREFQHVSIYAGRFLAERPEEWLLVIYDRVVYSGQYQFLVWLIVALIVGAVLPAALLVTVFQRPLEFMIKQRAVVEGGTDSEGHVYAGLDNDGRPEWQWYVDRIKDSPHSTNGPLGDEVREADHHFIGIEPHAAFPVLLDQKLLGEHCYMVGDSGSGKTSQGLMPLLIQLIQGRHNSKGERTKCPPIVILDLKGDPALFHLAKREAEARSVPFRVFTPEKEKPSHYFNPFASMDSKYRTDIQLCNLLMDALSLNHGEGYGRGYYGRQTRALLLAVMEGAGGTEGTAESDTESKARKRGSKSKKPTSFTDLFARLKEVKGQNEKEYKDTLELLATVEALTKYKMLATATSPAQLPHAIHMPTVLENNQVVYFYLPAAVESISVREIAKLALYSLLTACIDRQRDKPGEPRQVYLIIDEFQRIAGENFRVILEQARSYGMSVTLANQSVSDLKTPDVDLRPTVRTNTRVKRFFSLTDPQDIKAMVDSSGEELMYVRSWMQTAGAPNSEMVSSFYESRSDAQAIKPRLTQNDIMAISDHPLDSILLVSRGSGYTQFAGLPIPIRCTWPITRKDNDHLKTKPWPTFEELGGLGVAIESGVSPLDIERARDAEIAQENFGLLQSLNAQRT